MLDALAAAAKGARLAAGRTQLDVATTAGVNQMTISRFERAVSWPQDPDRIVAAYAEECDVEALELWRRAVNCAGPGGER